MIIPFVPERGLPSVGCNCCSAAIRELLPANPGLRPIACVPAMMDKNGGRTQTTSLS